MKRRIRVKRFNGKWLIVSTLGNTMSLIEWYNAMKTPFKSPLLFVIF